jgi:hypothetical protein
METDMQLSIYFGCVKTKSFQFILDKDKLIYRVTIKT